MKASEYREIADKYNELDMKENIKRIKKDINESSKYGGYYHTFYEKFSDVIKDILGKDGFEIFELPDGKNETKTTIKW